MGQTQEGVGRRQYQLFSLSFLSRSCSVLPVGTLISLPWEETTSECSQNLTEPKNPNNGSCLQLVNKQVSSGTQRLQLIMAIGHSFQAGTTALSDSDDKCSNQMRVLGFYTVDKLSAAVCISLLFSPVTRTVTQNLRDCFANISFFLQSIRTPES